MEIVKFLLETRIANNSILIQPAKLAQIGTISTPTVNAVE
jgi:hypothetical protein